TSISDKLDRFVLTASFEIAPRRGDSIPFAQRRLRNPSPSVPLRLLQKGRPPLASWLLGANSSHVLLDRALTHVKAQLQEFSTNPLSTPKPIVLDHLPDQGDG